MANPDLLGLPDELKLWIVHYLLPASPALLHLRATCRSMLVVTEQIVAKEYFRDRAFFIADETSLRVLHDISKHPVFVKSMERIRFSLATLPSSQFDYYSRKYDTRPQSTTMTRREQSISLREIRRTYDQLFQEAVAFEIQGGIEEYLSTILANFRDAGNTPAVIATGEPFRMNSVHTEAWGYARFRRALGYDRCVSVRPTARSSYFVLNEAIHEANYPIAELELGCGSLGVLPITFEMIEDKPFGHLKKLRISLAALVEEVGNRLMPEEVILYQVFSLRVHFKRFLLEAPMLEQLELTCEDEFWSEGDVNTISFRSLVSAAASPSEGADRGLTKLRVLKLDRLWIDLGRLLQLVDATRHTLQSLTLRRVKFEGCDPHELEGKIREVHGGESSEVDLSEAFSYGW